MISNSNFITTILNVRESDVENFYVSNDIDTVSYHITLKRKALDCPYCHGRTVGFGHKEKKISHPALRGKNGYIMYNANRYLCKSCGRTMFEPNPFTFPNFNSSYLLLDEVMKKLGNLNYTVDMISKELNISTTQINKYLDSYITIPKRPLPESIGIDEIHSPVLSKKNASYLCMIVDNERRVLYDILDSRSKNYLSSYVTSFKREERASVKYVTIDMWEPYKDVAYTFFPNAIVAVDPFHVIEHLCDDFEKLRISLMNQCIYGSNAYYLLKKWNWLMTKDNVELDNEKVFNHRFKTHLNRRDILNMIFETFPMLKSAYLLKEYYRDFNKDATYEEANEQFDVILDLFKNSGIPQYDEFIGVLTNWRTEIINSFKRPYANRKLSNSFTEETNGKIKKYISASNGLTNFTRFKNRAIYALDPRIFYALSQNLKTNKIFSKERGKYNK